MAVRIVDLDPRWILHEDEAILVLDKPAGVPSQAARPGAADDLPSRLGRALRERGEEGYVGVHQRLDAETSGAIVYARSRQANASLARQFEGHRVRKTYVAGVVGWPSGKEATLRDRLEDGRVVSQGGQPAVSHVRPLEHRGDRTLVEVRIETGRTHQIRAQLAHAGAPLAGDVERGGAPGSRLLLHSARLELEHPTRGAPLSVEAPLPEDFRAWLEGIDPRTEPGLVDAALGRAVHRRRVLLDDPGTTALRLLDEGEGLDGVAVDLYGEHALLHLYDPAADEGLLAAALLRLGALGVYVRRRPKKASALGAEERERVAPPSPIAGTPAEPELIVREHGLGFGVELAAGISTGLFLDQRDNRAWVRAAASGRRVLNLFAYTCGFTVAAAAGGAAASVSVDQSSAALDRGRRNLERGGFDPTAHRLVRADAFEWLGRAARRGERFDLVVCDPPTYSTTRGRKARWTSGKDWAPLAAACFAVLAPGGTLLGTSNDRRLTQASLRAHVRVGAETAGVTLESLRDVGPGLDFRPPRLRGVRATRARS